MTRILRYAQEYGGQKLHLVDDWGHGRVGSVALCGRSPRKRGRWRLTINVPLGHACGHCCRALERLNHLTTE